MAQLPDGGASPGTKSPESEVSFYLGSSELCKSSPSSAEDGTTMHGQDSSPGGSTLKVEVGVVRSLTPTMELGIARSRTPTIEPGIARSRTPTMEPAVDRPQLQLGEEEEIKFIDEDVVDISDSELIDGISQSADGRNSADHDTDTMETFTKSSTIVMSPSRDDIMTKFIKEEVEFQEAFLSPSILALSREQEQVLAGMASPPQDTVPGIGRLEQLVRILEQLVYLRGQNDKLRKKCLFLEDTRYILQVQNDMLMARDHSRGKSLFKQNQKVMHFFDSATFGVGTKMLHPSPGEGLGRQTSSPDAELGGSGKLQRSQSEGSLELVDIDLSTSVEKHHESSIQKSFTAKDYFPSRVDFSKKSRKLQQKWERVKKVFSGKPEHTVKTDAVSAEQLVKFNTKSMKGKYTLPDLENLPLLGESEVGQEDNPATPNSIQSEPSHMEDEGTEESEMEPDISSLSPIKRSHSADSITSSDEVVARRHFIFDNHSLSDACSLEQLSFLSLEHHLERRRSSPTISIQDPELEPMGMVRSSSVKVMKSHGDLDPLRSDWKAASSDTAKKAKAAWDRVKDIMIHTRRESLKKKQRRSRALEHAMSDGEISPDSFTTEALDLQRQEFSREAHTRGLPPRLAATRPVGSPVRTRPRRKMEGRGPSPSLKRQSLAHVMLSGSPPDITSLKGISDDFTKRMVEWEEKKKRGLVKANSFSCEIDSSKTFGNTSPKFSEDFIRKMEEWEQIKGLTSPPKSPIQDPPRPLQTSTISVAPAPAPAAAVTPRAVTTPELTIKPALHNLSASFSKTVQEWERVKERRAREGGSPVPEIPLGRPDEVERSKSRERERTRHKFEKELQKIERKEWKIEREKQKLDRMKMKLDLAMESSSGSEGLGDGLAFEMMLRQFQEKEARSSAMAMQQDGKVVVSASQHESFTHEESSHVRSVSTKDWPDSRHSQQRERILSDGSLPQRSISYEPYNLGDSPPEGIMMRLAEPARVVRTKSSETDDSTTAPHNISSEDSSSTLQQQLEEKEEQVKDLQYDVQQLTERINHMDMENNQKLESCKRQLKVANRLNLASSQTHRVDACIRELKSQVDILIQAQDNLTKEKQQLQMKYDTTQKEQAETRLGLLSQIQSLQEKVDQMSYGQTDPPRRTVSALCGLITQAQSQLNRLQRSLTNRNQTIRELERHLLTQKVNNKLAEAGLQRQALEISFLKEQRRKRVISRSKTFSGHDFCVRQDGSVEIRPDSRVTGQFTLSQKPTPPLTNGGDAQTFDIHSEWLTVLKNQILEENSKPESPPPVALLPVFKPCTTNTESQTIMTLCNCPNIPVLSDGSAAVVPASSVPPRPTTQATPEPTRPLTSAVPATIMPVTPAVPQTQTHNVSTQISLTHSTMSTQTDVTITTLQLQPVVVNASVTDVPVPTVSAQCTVAPKVGILKHTSQYRGEVSPSITCGVEIPVRPPPVIRQKAVSDHFEGQVSSCQADDSAAVGKSADVKGYSYQDWLRREPKPLKMSDTMGALSGETATEPPLGVSGEHSPEQSKDSQQEGGGGNVTLAHHLPHSPIIRSKNIRKLKTSDTRAATIAIDARMLKATPPRRFIRHRKNLVQRLSMGADVSDDLMLDTDIMRQRAKSDSSELQAACAVARENSIKRKQELGLSDLVTRRPPRSSSGVRDIISRYEDGHITRRITKSPSPTVPKFSVTATRRLKTAAELLQDSIDQKQHRSRSVSAADKLAAQSQVCSSSDKENSSVLSPVRQLSLDSSPVLRRDDDLPWPLDSSDHAGPLKDRTNNGQTESPRTSQPRTPRTSQPHQSQHRDSQDPPSDAEAVTTKLQPEPDTSYRKSPIKTRSPLARWGRNRVGSGVPTGSKPESTMSTYTTQDPALFQGGPSIRPVMGKTLPLNKDDSVDSQSSWSCRSSEQSDPCQDSCAPWQLQKDAPDSGESTERFSRSKTKPHFWSKESPGTSDKTARPKSKGPSRFFEKKRQVSPSPARGSVITALCMQSMTVSVEDDSCDSLASAPVTAETVPKSPGGSSDSGDKRSRRGKFLEGNWFQKPKDFFKVSKC